MSRRTRRGVDIFNLSFLDVVSCGFGAIILLLVIVKISEPHVIERMAVDLRGLVARSEAELEKIRGETQVLNRALDSRQAQLSEALERLALLKGELSAIRGEHAATRSERDAQTLIERQLAEARQTLSDEMRRLLGSDFRRTRRADTIGGVPVDSEYVVFIIDTSGSMRQNAWGLVSKKLTEVLEIYPRLKGIQVMNDMGDYMFSQYKGRWIPDTPARRRAVIKRMASWKPFSNSSPVEGIEAAIRGFYSTDHRISLYVFGDDFARGSIQTVIDTVSELNRADASGRQRVRIHAVGFPVLFQTGDAIPVNAVRYAALMRKLAETNGGTFVGLNGSIDPR